MIRYRIRKAIELWEKEKKQKFSRDRMMSDSFCTVLDDLESSIMSWPSEALELLNPRRWNLPNLMVDGHNIRKPKADFYCSITPKQNFVLEWRPDLSVQDFKISLINWGAMAIPMNRLVMIHDLQWLLYRNEGKRYPHSLKYLLEAVNAHVNYVLEILGGLIDINLRSKLYFEYRDLPIPRGKSRADVEDNELFSCKIMDIEKIAELENQKWLESTFQKIGFSPKEFLAIYMETGAKIKKFDGLLKQKGVKGLGQAGLANIIEKLKTDFSHLWFEVSNELAPELVREGKIIPLRPKGE